MRLPLLSLCGMLLSAVFAFRSGAATYFEPEDRLSGVGTDRERISELILEKRAELMTESQTFVILRDPRALAGAQRVTSPKLQRIFRKAADESGMPSSLISAVAYLESWGVPNEESPSGPKGIMQIAEGTARTMGLKIVYKTRYRTRKERKLVRKRRGKPVYRTVHVKVPYTVKVRDDRFYPERAIPAAAKYLARLESKYGGRDWAVWAYHCGEGCVQEVQSIARGSRGFNGRPLTVASVFFGAHPAYNRELYEALRRHMDRDYSPTYYFRIHRAEQLLGLYREDPAEFRRLYDEYRNRANPSQRAPHRLSVWLKPDDFEYQNCEDLKRNMGKKLMRALDDPDYFGFSLRKTGPGSIGERDPLNREYYMQAAPSALGTLTYIAFETRRLHEAMNRRGEQFVPLEVTSLVNPRDYETQFVAAGLDSNSASHCTGQVFDISLANLPPGEREALDFVLDDLGWHGYLGFIQEHAGGNILHIGPSPSSRDFFNRVWDEAIAAAASRQ